MGELQELWLHAWRFAARAHAAQKVPGRELPYLVHLGAVATEILVAHQLAAFEQPGLAVQCALLHDTLEDTAVREPEITARFGAAVAAGVLALTKDAALAKPEAMADSLRRIRSQPREVWAVKLADRITNLDVPPSHWLERRREKACGHKCTTQQTARRAGTSQGRSFREPWCAA